MNKSDQLELLIIYDYHPKEIFATKVGKNLERKDSLASVRVVKYTDKPDVKKSGYYLRRFAVSFNPLISPVVLHGDDHHFDSALIYRGKTKKKTQQAQKPLMNFCFNQYEKEGLLVCYGRFVDMNTKCGIIDIELNERMGLETATQLIERFSRYLIELSQRNIIL